MLAKQPVVQALPPNPNTLHPMGGPRNQLMLSSRQASSNASEGGYNRESSLDDSGVVDDHDEQDAIEHCAHVHQRNEVVSTDYKDLLPTFYLFIIHLQLQNELTPVTLALSPNEIRIIKCNGNIARLKKNDIYSFHPEYLSQLVVIGI